MKNSWVLTLVQLGRCNVHSDNKFVFAQEIEIALNFKVRVDCL